MTPRTFIGWLVVTLVTVVLAVFVALGRPTATFDPVSREPVFEVLRADPDAAAKLEVNSRFGAFTLVRSGGNWSTPDRYDYPVDERDVRRLIVALSDMRYIERKTSHPDRFARLEVEDIDDVSAESAYVKVSDAAGNVLAEAIVGRPSARFFDGSSSGTYIREPGTNNVWLVSGVANVQTRLIPWLKREIVTIPANTVARIELGEGDGMVELSRGSADTEEFVLADAPEGRELDQRAVTAISRSLANVELEDVKPRGELTLPADARVAKVTTFDGVAVTARLAEIDKKNWGVFDATFVGDPADSSDAAKAAREQVDAINRRVGKWIYWVPSATFDNLTKSREDILKDKPDDTS